MELLPIFLVGVSALGHAYWNFILKKIVNKSSHQLSLYWLSLIVSCTAFLPLFVLFYPKNPISLQQLIYPVAFGFFLAMYLLFLTKAYSYDDLSLAYPLTKTIPIFTLILGVFVLNETVSAGALAGIFFIVLGAYTIHLSKFSNFFKSITSWKIGSVFALLTAIVSAWYGLISKIALESMHPVVFIYLGFFSAFIIYSPIVLLNKKLRTNLKMQFQKYTKSIMTIGILDVFGYLLVLMALSSSQLSHIFALRQMSIIFAVLFGSTALKEKYGNIRFMSALIIVAGIVLISMS